MHLEEGNNFGLISQEVEQILPELVHSLKEPAVLDENGNVITDEVSFKALNYTSLIPILIAGFKEQQQRITDLMLDAAGENAGVWGSVATADGAARPAGEFIGSRPTTIYGGSNEVQRNILAKAVLGLPGVVGVACVWLTGVPGSALESATASAVGVPAWKLAIALR